MFTFIGVILLVAGIAAIVLNKYEKERAGKNAIIEEANSKKSDKYYHDDLINPIFTFPGKPAFYILGAVTIFLLNGMFFWAAPGTAYAVQYPWGGDAMVKTQGLKLKFWGRTIPLSYEISVKDMIIEDLPDNDAGTYNRQASKWEFADAIKAKIATSIIIGVSVDDEDKFLNMADRNRSEGKLIYGRVLPNIDAALKNTCKLMDAQDYISGEASDFDRYFKDQLENGMYLVEEYYDEESIGDDTSAIGDTNIVRHIRPSKSSKAKKYRPMTDRQGNIMRDESSNTLKQYGLTIFQATVTSIDWEESFDKRLDKQKNEVALTQLEKQQAERQYYTMKKEIAAGESAKATERALLEKEQIKLTIAAETKAKVAVQNVIVEKAQLEVEKLKAKSVKVKAEALYYKNQKMVSAGLTPQQRLEGQIKMNSDKWKYIGGITFPSTYFASPGTKGGGMLESLIGANMAKGMTK
jgi:hypothetical protein